MGKRTPTLIRWSGVALAIYAALGGVVTLIGWFAGIPRLTDWGASGIAMFPNTALAALCAGAALLLLIYPRRWRRHLSAWLGLSVFLLGGATLLQHIAGIDLNIDAMLIRTSWGHRAAVAPGRMGPPASTCYTLIGLALVLINSGSARARRFVPALAIAVSGIAALALMGYACGADPLFSAARYTGIALQTASILLALGLATLTRVPEFEPMRTLQQDTAAGMLARRSLPFIIALPLLLGWLRVRGQQLGWYDTAIGTAILTLLLSATFCGLLAWWVRAVALHEQQLRQRRDALLASETRYRSLFEVAAYGVLTIDDRGLVDSANPAAERLFGYTAAEVIGRPVSILMPEPFHREPDDPPSGISRIIGIGREVTGRRKDGSTFPMELAVSEFRRGEQRYFTGLVYDISERKRAQEQQSQLMESERAARSEAENAGRMKDQFLATLSHELRTPLTAILGWSRLIGRNPADPEAVREGIEVITRNAKMQADLIADLLDMSSIVSGKLRLELSDVDLAAVVRAAVDAVRPSAAAKRIRIEPDLGQALDPLRGDAGRLQQVVWNLLTNAIKFTPAGGQVQVVLARRGSQAEIRVIDSGMGIKPEFLPHVFERFRQADATSTRQYGGLGLGLALARQLVELHGGAITAHSEGEGQGATFIVHLPFARTHQDSLPGRAPNAADVLCDGVDLAGIRVLAIDDQADTRELLVRILRACRAEVRAAASADEALELLATCDPHVVLCDISMPGKDGYQFIEEMQGRHCAAPAVAVTAYARPEDRLRALRAGYRGHLAKPIEPAQLVATVAAVAGRPPRAAPAEQAG